MLLMALCFLLLWAPFTICEILNVIWEDGVDQDIIRLTQALGMLHSIVSPILSMASLDRDWSKGNADILVIFNCNNTFGQDFVHPFVNSTY